ncbi:hypothetical protein GGH96_000656 [Coemansia sp. RSA 1972]|nr:hypothetical protein GGH96_000656 [Coemansia sp. RSA 1972]
MNKTHETYAAGLSRNHAFDALPRSNDEQEKSRIPKITMRRVVYYFIWAMIQLTVLIYKIYQGSKAGDTFAGYSKGVEALMMTCLSTNFLLMAPTLMRMLRATPLRRFICFDKTTHAHKVVAYTLVFWVAHHVVARYYKFYTIQAQSNGKVKMVDLLYGKLTGRIGHTMLTALSIILLSALPSVRRKYFELFYLLHHLSFLIVILIFVHIKVHTFHYYITAPGIVYLVDRIYRMIRARLNRPQIHSVILHPSDVIELRFARNGIKYKAGQFIYLCVPSLSWYQWHPFTLTSAPEEDELSVHIRVSGGWTGKLVDTFRQCASSMPSRLTIVHPRTGQQSSTDRSKVMSTDTERTLTPSYNQHIQSPRGARGGRGRGSMRGRGQVQRQPSNRSAHGSPRYPPEMDYYSGARPYTQLHMRANKSLPAPPANASQLPTIMVDGPYGAPTQDVFDYSHILLICGNIGVTPMSSVLKSLYYQLTTAKASTSVKKVYFVWSCRDVQALEWFRDLLAALDMEDIGDILEIRTYLTGQLPVSLIRNIALNQSSGGPDAVTGLYRSPTYYGRPDFDSIFGEIGKRNPSTDIGVFFCGSRDLGRKLHKTSRKWTSELKHRSTSFSYHEERSTE